MRENRKFTITGHMVVKNEDRWIWFSIMSVIEFLDKLIIFDTGSIDKTNDIIERIALNQVYKDKIIYKKIDAVSVEEFSEVRQRQIDITDTDYFMVVDGDEIWYKETLIELEEILDYKPKLVATRFINACGDVFHYRHDNRETYCINGETGAITIRVYSMSIPGISCGGVYGVEGYIDYTGKAVQERDYSIVIQKGRYFHTSLLNRSSAQFGDFSIKYRRKKIRSEWDDEFPRDFKYPEIFYTENLPKYIKSPFIKDRSIIRTIYQFLRRIKRMVG